MPEMDWDAIDVASLLPEEKQYSIVQLDFFKPPDSPDAAVKVYEVEDLGEAEDSTPDKPGIGWLAYDSDGNSTQL